MAKTTTKEAEPVKVSPRSAGLMKALDALERKITRTADRAKRKARTARARTVRPKSKSKARPSSGAKATRAARGRSKR